MQAAGIAAAEAAAKAADELMQEEHLAQVAKRKTKNASMRNGKHTNKQT